MTELSPAAQEVLNAFNRAARPEPHHQREAIAAVLRAAAEQGATFYLDGCPVQAVTVGSLLTIATQLETQP